MLAVITTWGLWPATIARETPVVKPVTAASAYRDSRIDALLTVVVVTGSEELALVMALPVLLLTETKSDATWASRACVEGNDPYK